MVLISLRAVSAGIAPQERGMRRRREAETGKRGKRGGFDEEGVDWRGVNEGGVRRGEMEGTWAVSRGQEHTREGVREQEKGGKEWREI